MVSQLIWIGIVIAAFVVGLGSTYLIFHTGGSDVNANFIKMENAQHAQEIAMLMNENHNFTMEMMSVMIEDPTLQLQMIGHMAENPEAMKQMMNLMDKEMIMFTMTDSDQIQMMEDMMDDMMQRMQNDPELEQAMMEHMEQMKSSRDAMMGTDDSMMNGMIDTKTNFPSSELPQENSNLENEFDSCTSDWYITGYFLPIESDYSGESVEVSVDGVTQSYLSDFLEVVKIEGCG